MPDQLNATLAKLDATLHELGGTIRSAQAASIKAAADAARAADDVRQEKWWRRATIAVMILLSLALGAGMYDTRQDAAEDRSRVERDRVEAEAEARQACLNANDIREDIQSAIVGVLESLALSDGVIDEEEEALIAPAARRVDDEIPERDCS